MRIDCSPSLNSAPGTRNIISQDDIDGTNPNMRIGEIEGFDESGSNSWRADNDAIFIAAVNAYNAKYGLSPGDDGYWTPLRLKAQAMLESGGDKTAFLSDPLQVNVSGDWVPKKASLLGLTKNQTMTPAVSAKAALGWLRYKGSIHDSSGKITGFRGNFEALRRYNGNLTIYPSHPGVQHRDYYGGEVLRLESVSEPLPTQKPHGFGFGIGFGF